ncbi:MULTISPECIES: SDR family NAD(P)-dependent oxidoreductase [Comamonas]|uniref:SDR family NAD(P)-dependent oxidoreductase n=1 Tax=Comamonas TaxID=283 RepID=UPI0006218C31|nr:MULTISPECIES: SDR family oxidoreductase [Comamonas]KKI11718.1 2-deoxy-D-gluconate 3-dehydrogenase [Comamonas thiooxydans]TYK68603.1 SDR family oxidoreductase [Comamonas sp. Z1]WKL14387.1 SDR family oxidoreductase [Comamonas testosteroni]BCX51753.1 short-chain dehydrogenase [Comamonas testosteroni]
MLFDFSGKHALVSGGTSGIGLAIAQALCSAGCTVTSAGLLSDVPDSNEDLKFVEMDVTNSGSIDRVVSTCRKLDIVINAAGVIRRGEEHDPTVFQRVIDINLNGSMRVAASARYHLSQSGGCLVNIASMLSFFGGGLVPAYSASKGGVAQLTKSLAIAWASDGVRVNAVAPGWIATPLTKGLQEDPQRSASLLQRTPLGRWGEPNDITGPVMFLCSSAASFVTGAVLPVDGGYLVA